MISRWNRLLLVGLLLAAPALTAQKLPTAAPAKVGLAADRLDRLHQGMQGFVDRHEVSGIVTLLARDGKVIDLHAVGAQDTAANRPMRVDTLFRIASMSKPITSVAVMMLFEEGRLQLTDPIAKYIPSFKDVKVLVKNDSGADTLVPARRAITIRDLLTHRSGLTYGFIDRGPVGDAYRKGAAGQPAGRRISLQPRRRRARPAD
jgi:CubicO group peptidase (beta-lactamase class C family)